MTDRTVLILSPGLSQSVAIARLLRRHRPNDKLVGGYLPREWIPSADLYDQLRQIDFPRREGLAADIVIPTGAHSTQLLCGVRDRFTVGEAMFEAENIRVGNKSWMLGKASDLGVPCPKTWFDYYDVPQDNGQLFYKPAQEGAPKDYRMVRDKASIPESARGSDFIFQEYIGGSGTYGYAFIADRGRVICAQGHHEKRSDTPFGGSASVIERWEDPRLTDYSQRILQALHYSGWGLVEFKYCPRRRDYVFMEVNAKFWASFEFTLRNNPCFARLLFGIESKVADEPGLVWPARLLASGLGPTLLAMPDLARFRWIFDPSDIRMVAAAWTPKKFRQRLASRGC